ncbi:carbohydrate sulfotransferase 11 isoform X5 [Cherax quadricarinatus]|uniref:carbohydrate sulfotransferase 11 isoform X5 n=1 Tax=Cherax quadricarinatus TaxID=27406 RepID=UPI00387E9AF8
MASMVVRSVCICATVSVFLTLNILLHVPHTSPSSESSSQVTRSSAAVKTLNKPGKNLQVTRSSAAVKTFNKPGKNLVTRSSAAVKTFNKPGKNLVTRSSAAVKTLNKPGKNLIEEATLPATWSPSPELIQRLEARRQHLHQMCAKEGLDQPTEQYQINAWEFLINKEYGLVWCNVFKAASSTWLWNFNLLAGYTQDELLSSNKSPVQLARLVYPRPTPEELQQVMNETPAPLSFMITRHPLLRLVSAYRNKILNGNPIYKKLFSSIYSKYKKLGPPVPRAATNGKKPPKNSVSPSFSQFVQWVLDEVASGKTIDMHWIPQSSFCTPCLVDFTVLAKVETLREDANYIINTSKIDGIIQPKVINRSTGETTEALAVKLLCQLSNSQMNALLDLYRVDLLLFDYDASTYLNCSTST